MQRMFRSMIVLTIVLTIVSALTTNVLTSSAFAKGGKKAKKGNDTPASTLVDKMIKSVTGLTEDQTKKLDALKDEYNPKLKDAYAKLDSVLTPDQVSAGQAAQKAAKAEGKKGKDLSAAVTDAQKITDDQKKQMTDDKMAVGAITKELTQKVTDLLTDAQKAEIKPKKGKK